MILRRYNMYIVVGRLFVGLETDEELIERDLYYDDQNDDVVYYLQSALSERLDTWWDRSRHYEPKDNGRIWLIFLFIESSSKQSGETESAAKDW